MGFRRENLRGAMLEKQNQAWLADVCADRRLKMDHVRRSHEAIMDRLRSVFAQTIRDELGGRHTS